MSVIAGERIKRMEVTNWQPSEDDEQKTVMEWAMLMSRQFPELELLHHIPNGGSRHPAEAQKLKAMGVKAGVPDLFLPVARGGAHGLWVEMKRRKGGKLSPDQKAWIEALTAQHYTVIVAHGADEACDAIYQYLEGE